MREGGQYKVTSSQQAYIDFYAYQWPTIKTEIWNACRTDRMLESSASREVVAGNPYLVDPTDFDAYRVLYLYDASDDYRGTVVGGGLSSVTLAATFTAESSFMLGKPIFVFIGSGLSVVGYVTSWDNTTKIATMHNLWGSGVSPAAGQTYLVGCLKRELPRVDYVKTDGTTGVPRLYCRNGTQTELYPVPDKQYAAFFTYTWNLAESDEADTRFIKHLKERRHLWVQGVKVKTMARYDDDRYGAEKSIWEQMLAQYGGQNAGYSQMAANR